MDYEPLIGLEIHAELATLSKLFCSCPVEFDQVPNSLTCPVCLGLPGSLPVVNRKAVELAGRAILALGGRVNGFSRFARKNYFYPDTPKGYQITQHDFPLGWGGEVMVEKEEMRQTVAIKRIHLEEDAGKLVHQGAGDGRLSSAEATLVDYNRCGVPLIEIVSEAQITSADMAQSYLEEVKRILEYAGISDCRMDQGSLRVDGNISLHPRGSCQWGERVEIKNLSSGRALTRALNYEMQRQGILLRRGKTVAAETRHWDEAKEVTVVSRSKETQSDYRYFPEPDLPPLGLSETYIEELARSLPELPGQRRKRLQQQQGLSPYVARVLTDTRELADFYEETVAQGVCGALAANWIMGELMYHTKGQGRSLTRLPFGAKTLGRLLRLTQAGDISAKVTKEALARMFDQGVDPLEWIEEQGLSQISDEGLLVPVVDQILEDNTAVVESYHAGKVRALDRLVGQVMQATRGRANPRMVNDLLRERLGSWPRNLKR